MTYHKSLYGKKVHVGTSPVTVVGERYDRVYYVLGHHDVGEMDSDAFRKAMPLEER